MAKYQGNSHHSSMHIKFMRVVSEHAEKHKKKEDEKKRLSSMQEESPTKNSEDKNDKDSLKNQIEDKLKNLENIETKLKEVQKKPAMMESEKNIETILNNENDKAKVIITELVEHPKMVVKNLEQITSQTNAITKNTEIIPKAQDVVDFKPKSDEKIPEIKALVLTANKDSPTKEIKDIQKTTVQSVNIDKKNAMPTDNKIVQAQVAEKTVLLAETKIVPVINPPPTKLNEVDKKIENVVVEKAKIVENPPVILEPKKEIKLDIIGSKVEAKSIIEEKIISDKTSEISRITNIQPAQQAPVNKTLLSSIMPNPIIQNSHIDEVKKIGEVVTKDFHL